MTHQDIFDIVSLHLLRQNKRSTKLGRTGKTLCAYRGADGTKCAVGALIPDGHYHATLEGLGVFSTEVKDTLRHVGVLGALGASEKARTMLLRDLQVVHDAAEPADWPQKLVRLAREYHLQLPTEFEALVTANQASRP